MSEETIIIDPLDAILKQFNIINDTLTLFKMQINSIQQQIKHTEKNVKKELTTIKKDKKKDIIKQKRSPSGFAKPTMVTKELCEFMDQPEGTQIARTEVTKALVSYIKSNNLLEQDTSSKNIIIPDQKLKNLLGVEVEDLIGLTYFNIQKYMNKHFVSNKSSNNIASNNSV